MSGHAQPLWVGFLTLMTDVPGQRIWHCFPHAPYCHGL
jgi:hypothetical protein